MLLPDQSSPSNVTNMRPLIYGLHADGRDGGCRLHRVEPRRRARGARRRGRRRRQLRDGQARVPQSGGDAARARHPRAVPHGGGRGLPSRRASGRADVDAAPRVRRGGERRRHGQRAERVTGGAGDLLLVGRRRLRRVPGARGRGRAVPPPLAVRDREEVRRGVPARLESHSRHVARAAALRERLRPAAGRGARGRRRRDLSRADGAQRADTIFGDGTQGRDFVYVDDVVAALLASVGKSGGPYNVGTGEATTVAQLHEAAAEVAGVEDAPRFEEARLGDVHRSVLDVGRIERELGWRAAVPLGEGMARTWAWMQERAAA